MRQEWRRERDRADFTTVVMPGLDPGIHPLRQRHLSKKMDRRVKPGDDQLRDRGVK
jgi:hypothetical protein